MNRRLLFVQKRMVEVIFEFQFAQGTIAELPKGAMMPPEWALVAAQWIGKNSVKAPTTAEVLKDPRGALEETIGRYEALLGYVTHEGVDQGDDDEVRRVTKKLQRFTSRLVSRGTLHGLKKFGAALEKILPPIGAKQVIEYNKRKRRGISSVVDEEGEIDVLKTAQSEIYYYVFFFWPKLLEMMPSITAKKLKTWLGKDFGIYTSVETVEIVYSKLKLASFKSAGA